MHWGYKFTKLQEKINHLIYMHDIKLFARNEKELEINTNNKNIQSGHRNVIWHRKMCHAHNGKWEKTNNRIELPKWEWIKMFREKENQKYFGILEADTIKQVEMKEKITKRVSQMNKKASWNKCMQQESHQRDKNLGCPPHKILGTILEMVK